MYWKKALTAFLILGSLIPYAQTKVLSLEEAIDYALKHAYSIQLSEQDIKIAAAQIQEKEGKAGPKVSLKGNYIRNTPPSTSLDVCNLVLDTSFPVDLNRVISLEIQSSHYNKIINEKFKDQQKINLISDIKNSAYTILLNARILKLYQDRQETSKDNMENIAEKVENRVAATYDQYIALRDLESSKYALLNSELTYKASKKAFNNLIGCNLNQEFELQEITELPQLAIDKNRCLAECYNRADIQVIDYKIEQQKCMYKIELGALAPSLGVSLFYTQTQKIHPKSLPNSHVLTGGLALTIPILDSGIANARAKQVEENIIKLEVQKKQLLSQIEMQLDNALDQLKNSCRLMDVIKLGLAAAKEAYRIALLRFNENQSIQLELSSAKDSLTQVNIDYDTSFFNILKAYNEIERITGVSIKTLSENKE